MSKKKKKALPPPPLPEVTPQELEEARALIAGIGMDIAYGNAKKRLKRDLDWSSELANAVVVKLYEEGFESDGTKNWFVHPGAQTATGVVQGARRPENMTVSPQGELGEDLPVPPFSHYIPGDVVELRRSVTGWRIGRFIARPQKRWVCHLYFHTGEYAVFRPVSSFAPFDLGVPAAEIPAGVDLEHDAVELELPADAAPDAVLSTEVFDDDDNYLLLPAKFVRKVGVMNDPLGEMQIASAQFGVPIDFSPETLAEAAALPDRVDRRSLAHRVDLTDLPFVTIDGEDARDFDDAVYCAALPEGGWRLLVAIADVSRYVKPDSPLDRDAQIRATSVYFPASVVPMLPEKLSNGLCSLNPGVDRLVMVCDALVSAEGDTTAYQFYPGVIHSHARLTYTAVWSALQGEPAGLEALGPRIEEVRRLHALYKALRARRAERHALDFETQESQADFNDKGEITGFHVRDHNDAHRMIEEAMLVANVCAAEFVLAKKQMTLFRVHDKPDVKKLNELKTLLSSFGIKIDADPKKLADELSRVILETKGRPYIQTAVLRTMQRACYQPDNIGHFGLQYPAYAHFTSPIRRYPDLLLHRTIKGILAKKPYVPKIEFDDAEVMTGYHARKLGARPEAERAVKSEEKTRAEARKAVWRRLGIICSSAERRADDASRDVMKFLKCEFLRKRIGKCWDGVVTGMCPAGVFVELEQMPVEGFVHISKLGWGYYDYDPELQKMTSYDEMVEVRLGDRVRVRLESVELDARRINFSLETSYARHTIKGAGGGRRRRGSYWSYDGFEDDDDEDFY